MKVDLPTPGTPETPTPQRRLAPAPAARSSRASARRRWSARVDSSRVIALATARRWRSPLRRRDRRRTGSWSAARQRCHRRAAVQCAASRLANLLEDVLGARRDRRARPVDALDAGVVEEVVVLRRDHAADEDDDVAAALGLERLDDRRHQRHVAGGERRDADRVDVVLDRLAGAFLGGLEQRADVDVEAEVGEGAGDDLGAAVVAVLAELGDHHARPAPLVLGEGGDLALELLPALGAVVGRGVDARDLLRVGAVPAPGGLERVADLADRGAQAHRLDR